MGAQNIERVPYNVDRCRRLLALGHFVLQGPMGLQKYCATDMILRLDFISAMNIGHHGLDISGGFHMTKQHIGQKEAHPGVPGLGIGGDPDNS